MRISRLLVLCLVFTLSTGTLYSSDDAIDIETIREAIAQSGAKWTAAETEISRMSVAERTRLLTTCPSGSEQPDREQPARIATAAPPTSYSCADWMTSVKNVGYCGGGICAMVSAGMFEARYNKLLDDLGYSPFEGNISEQTLLSCHHGSCDGCFTQDFLQYFLDNGVPDEDCFPYVADAVPCSPCADISSRLYEISAHGRNWSANESSMMVEIYDNGPIAGLMTVCEDFYAYGGGIYEHVSGTCLGNGGLIIYGWGNEGGVDYWLCKNHWGTYWGEVGPDGNRGWFRIRRGVNESNCEVYMWYLTPVLKDADSDGVPDSEDICPGHPDGVDVDGDFIPDGCDNCPTVYNPDQADSDEDEIGDACEPCCIGRVGDANGLGGDEPTIGDVSVIIDALFISASPDPIACLAEADVNQSGGLPPGLGDVTIGDVSILIDYLFITGSSLGLPDCLE